MNKKYILGISIILMTLIFTLLIFNSEDKKNQVEKSVSEDFLIKYNKICKMVKKEEFDLGKKNNISFIEKTKYTENEDKEDSSGLFVKDKNNVYFICKKIENADPKTFELLNIFYSKDKNNVYVQNMFRGLIRIDKKIDSKTFTILNTMFSKDKNSVYAYIDGGPIKLLKAESSSFKILNYYYAIDSRYAYINNEEFLFKNKVMDIDVKTFKIFGGNSLYEKSRYSADKNYVYYLDSIIKKADMETFKVVSETLAKDKNSCYEYGLKVSMNTCNE